MSEPNLNEIKQAIADVARGVDTLALGSRDRDGSLRDIVLQLAKVLFVSERMEKDVNKMSLVLDGTNGGGLKARLLSLEEKVKTLLETGTDQTNLRRMWFAWAVALLGIAVSIFLNLRR